VGQHLSQLEPRLHIIGIVGDEIATEPLGVVGLTHPPGMLGLDQPAFPLAQMLAVSERLVGRALG
jgi:hypothetical protein